MSHPQPEVCLCQICCVCPRPHLQERRCFCCLHADAHQERDVCKAHFWESVQLLVITLSSSLWPLASCMVLCCPQTVLHCVPAVLAPTLPLLAALAPATGPLHLLLFLSAVFFLSQGFFFSLPLFTLLFRVTFSKRPPFVRPWVPPCHHSLSPCLLFYYVATITQNSIISVHAP